MRLKHDTSRTRSSCEKPQSRPDSRKRYRNRTVEMADASTAMDTDPPEGEPSTEGELQVDIGLLEGVQIEESRVLVAGRHQDD